MTHRSPRLAGLLAPAVPLLLAAAPLLAQDAEIPDVSGVFIDAEGTLRVRDRDRAGELAARRQRARLGQSKDLVYLSLPRLFAQVRQHVEAGAPLPPDLRYLGGMVKLRYVFVYPDAGDLVIAGQREKLVGQDRFRPTGEVSGRPALHLVDLVVALRALGPGGTARGFGCSIDVPAGAQERVNQVIYGPGRPAGGRRAVLARLPGAVGPQEIRIFGLPRDSRFAFVCVEADYLMKRQSLGLDPPPLPQVRYQFSRRQAFNRAWFKSKHEPLLVSEDSLAYEIRGQGIGLDTTGAARGTAPASANAVLYARRFTHFFPQLAKLIPAYADLWNLSDLGLLAALIRQDRLHHKVGWNMDWLLDPSAYPLRPVQVPRTAEALANHQSGTYAVGGVYLSPAAHLAADQRQTDTQGKVQRQRRRPEADHWLLLQLARPPSGT